MSRTLVTATLVALSLCLAGCPAEPPPAAPSAPAPAAAAAAPQKLSAQVVPVMCGCTLTEVGHCGDWAEVDGKHVEIVGDLGLGDMPFCGKQGLTAAITGEVEADGKLHATKLELTK